MNKYTAVAIDLSQRGNSAVFYGIQDESCYHVYSVLTFSLLLNPGLMNEYYAVIWLNSFAPNAAAENDGIVVFGEGSGACLQDNGGSIDSAVHRDFVSINSSINIDTKAMCSKTIDSELIPRKHNRLTLIAPNRAFMLSSPGDASVAKKSFDTKTAVAIVFSLSPQKF